MCVPLDFAILPQVRKASRRIALTLPTACASELVAEPRHDWTLHPWQHSTAARLTCPVQRQAVRPELP